ncbi:MAG: hypothetical protein HKN29_14585 [Rhodothermales bacterium]|nr:hypothetical protein [Rhodothermales bacterium]
MRRMLLAGIVVTLVGGCAPSLSPLYRDYRDEADAGADVYSRIERALDAAEWSTRDAVTDNVVATEPRSIRSWGIYSVEIELEVVPLAGNHVRVFVNPYRHFFQGTRRKVPYLRNSWARSLRDLTESLEAEGLTYEGTAIQRVREAGVR